MNVEPRGKFVNGEGVNHDLRLKGNNRILHHSDVFARSFDYALPRTRFSSPRRLQQRESGEFPEECSETPPWVKSLQQKQNGSDCVASKSKREKVKADHFFLPWSDEDMNGKINKNSNKVKIEPPGPFLGDAFGSGKVGVGGTNKLLKSRIKNAICEKPQNSSKKCMDKSGVSAKRQVVDKMSKKQAKVSTQQWSESVPSEPFVVDWCRTSHLKSSERRVVEGEATSTTSATSRSKDLFETMNSPKPSSPIVSKSPRRNTGFIYPKTKAKRLVPTTKVPSDTITFFREFDFEVTHLDDAFSGRDPVAFKEKKTNVSVGDLRSTRKPPKSNTESKDKDYLDEIGVVEPSKVTWTRETLVSPRRAKPRLSMTVNNSAKKKAIDTKRGMKQVIGNFEKGSSKVVKLVTENEKLSKWAVALDSVKSKMYSGTNSEPLDFSEFDTEDFSSEEGSGDFSDPSVLSVQPTLPLYCSADNDVPFQKSFFQSSDDMENFWSSPFSFK
jgi:hypothetical protein